MNFEPKFNDRTTQRIWDNYFKRIRKSLNRAPHKISDELILELKSHLYESFEEDKEKSESNRLLNAIERMGDPDEFLKPIIADKLLIDASKSFNPKSIFYGIYYNLYGGIARVFLALILWAGYLIAFFFSALAVLKIFFPQRTGLFYSDKGVYYLGFMETAAGKDVLGYYFIPIALLISAVLFWILTKLLRLIIRN